MKKNLFLLFVMILVISITGCGKKAKTVVDNMAVDEVADAVYVCKNVAQTGEEKEYTLITTGDGKVKTVLYSAYIKVSSAADVNTYCDAYKKEKDKYNEEYVYGDVSCDQEKFVVTTKQEWTINSDVNKKYPDYIKKHVNSVGEIDIKGMKKAFATDGYECIKR